MFQNNASEDGGGIYATMATVLHLRYSSITLNNATNSGGGMALLFDSLLHCSYCSFIGNIAKQGGGCYTESNVQQNTMVQMSDSKFENNSAEEYGGDLIQYNKKRYCYIA